MSTPVELSPDVIEEFVIAAHDNFDKVREMLEREPNLLNQKWAQFDENALEASGHMGRGDIATYVLGKGASLTVFAAAMLGRTDDVAAFLRDEPGLASALGVHGISILHHAASSGKIEIVEMLVANGGGQGSSHALHAAVEPGHTEMVKWLLDHDANPNIPDFYGKTPLDVALSQGYSEMAEMIRNKGGVESVAK